jgi:hypothetical protein
MHTPTSYIAHTHTRAGKIGIRGYLRDVAAGGEQVEVDLDLGRLDGEERGGGGGALGGRGTSSRRPGGRGGGLCMLDCTGGRRRFTSGNLVRRHSPLSLFRALRQRSTPNRKA